jgi:ParB family chromosome partitioning protein
LEDHISEESCKAEIRSFSTHGQLVPALGRPLTNDPDFDVELICGARRLFVARHLKAKLLVEIRELSDIDAIVAMDIENRQREDISPYERGVAYATWLRGRYFESQQDLAGALKVSASQVSRLVQLSRLPAVVVKAFRSPSDIREGWGKHLAEILADCGRRDSLITKARALGESDPKLTAVDVYRRLLAAAAQCKRTTRGRDEVVKDEAGSPLFRIRYQTSSIALVIPTAVTSEKTLGQLRDAVTRVLKGRNSLEPHLPVAPSSKGSSWAAAGRSTV